MDVTADLATSMDELARASVLLVAMDFDGTVAPIVNDPTAAEMSREAAVALRMLEGMPQTHVAIISGRALADLAERTRDAGDLHLVGSHGSEFEPGFAGPFSEDAQALLRTIEAEAREIAASLPGAIIEQKPASLAFHYRMADESAAGGAVERFLSGPARRPGVYLRQGKKVVELSVVQTDKGAALQRMRRRLGATAVLFVGDDVTDEDAFATLTGPDVGVKVGPGGSLAAHRVADVADVARLLAHVAERRTAWLEGAEAVPIQHHSILSDQRTLAVVNPTGRIVWLCLPRIDSSAVFAELLGGPVAGFFEVRSADHERPVRQRYLGDSFVLQTEWPDITVTDYMDASGGRAFQRAGRTDLIRVIEGRGRARVTFAPRLDYGRMGTRLERAPEGVVVEGAIDAFVLRAPGLPWDIQEDGRNQTATTTVELNGEPVVLDLRYGTANLDPWTGPERLRRERTTRFWAAWAESLSVPAAASDLVRRSALVLKALTYGPTGAIAAAATTSLPEQLGGVRNWDYRFCWPRDAAMAAAALARMDATGPGIKLLDWLLGILEHAEPGALLSPVYTVTGGHLGPEAEIRELAGYRGSRPVRVGNAAAQQVQLDVFGPIADLVAVLALRGAALSSEHWRLIESLVLAVERRWREPDHGIWEIRLARSHHVHSKVMCWLTVDRALAIGKYLGRSRPEWRALRDEIAADVLQSGFSPAVDAFCGTYGGRHADAAALSVGLSGLLAADDPRFCSTVQFIERELQCGASVYRYREDDGLPGVEGTFHLCVTWLIEAYRMMGRRTEAELLFGGYCRLAGPTGLLAEEYDAEGRMSLGNFPQAYSHLGLINAAQCLSAP